jgi:predicted transcriptional regulator
LRPATRPLRTHTDEYYLERMAKPKEFDLERRAPLFEDEDEKTLAAIDEGIHDSKAGRTTSIEEVRKLLYQWVSLKS